MKIKETKFIPSGKKTSKRSQKSRAHPVWPGEEEKDVSHCVVQNHPLPDTCLRNHSWWGNSERSSGCVQGLRAREKEKEEGRWEAKGREKNEKERKRREGIRRDEQEEKQKTKK